MTVRAVEWKKPYTWGKAITVDPNTKVISLNLIDENNLIVYDSWDDEIYVDLQLPEWIETTDAFPVWVTTGRVLVADWWSATGTIISAKTTSGDNIKILYADNNKLYIDNGTWTFKQIYLKAEVDALLLALRQYIDTELANKQDKMLVGTDTPSSTPGYVWQMFLDTVNNALFVATWTTDETDWKGVWLTSYWQYTITFKNYDGTILETQTVRQGETPVYTWPTPTRSYSVGYGIFLWFGNIVPATEDAEYIAQFVGSCQWPCEDWFHVPSRSELYDLYSILQEVFYDGSSTDFNAMVQYTWMWINPAYYEDRTTVWQNDSLYWGRDIEDSGSGAGWYVLLLGVNRSVIMTASRSTPIYASVRWIADDQSYDYDDYNLIYSGDGYVYKHKTENKLLLEGWCITMTIASEDCTWLYQHGNNYWFSVSEILYPVGTYSSKVDVSQIQPSTYSDSKPFYDPNDLWADFWTMGTNWYGLWGWQIV